CIFTQREYRNGKPVMVQHAVSFRKGLYRLPNMEGTVDNVTAARDYKAQKDREKYDPNKVHDLSAESLTLGEWYARWYARPSDHIGIAHRANTERPVETAWRVHLAPSFAEVPVRLVN